MRIWKRAEKEIKRIAPSLAPAHNLKVKKV